MGKEQDRLDALINMISSMASLDFSVRMDTEMSDKPIDIIANGLNMLNEELEFNYVEREKLNELNLKLDQYRRFFDLSIDLVCIAGTDGYFKEISPSFEEALGYTKEEILADPFVKLIHAEDVEATQREVQGLAQGKETIGFQNRFRKKDGDYIWLSWVAVEKDGLLYAVARDITSQKMYEEELNNLNSSLMDFIEAIDVSAIVAVTDAKGKITKVNDQFCEISGYTEEELLGQDHRLINSGYHPPEFFQDLWKTISSGNVWKGVVRNKRKDGGFYWVKTTIVPFLDEEGTPKEYLAIRADITEQIEMQFELIEAQKETDKAKRVQEQFLANMSHEIRTPMNGIKGMLELLSGTTLNAEQKDFVDTIQQSTDNLMVIINDILDLSKINAGSLLINEKKFDIKKFIDNQLKLFSPKAIEKNIDLASTVDSTLATEFLGDEIRLSQITSNLLSNAIKFTDEGHVKLEVQVLNDDPNYSDLNIVVKDTGKGIKEDRIKEIFENFVQEDADIHAVYGGTGLGLTITKRLVDLMGGTINVESEVDQGSSFSVKLRLAKNVDANLASGSEKVITPITMKKDSLDGLRVLIVEDNPINQKVAGLTLKQWGVAYEVAENGKEGYQKVKEEDFGVVLMDVLMPVMDGFEATRMIRSSLDAPKSEVPIIAMTASALRGDHEKCLAVGMNDYISKPFDADVLYNTLKKYWKQSKKEKSTAAKIRFFDFKKINELSDNDPAFLKEMMGMYLKEVEEITATLKTEIEKDHPQDVYQLLHRLKPTLTLFGLQLSPPISELETQVKGKEQVEDSTKETLLLHIETLGMSLEEMKKLATQKN